MRLERKGRQARADGRRRRRLLVAAVLMALALSISPLGAHTASADTCPAGGWHQALGDPVLVTPITESNPEGKVAYVCSKCGQAFGEQTYTHEGHAWGDWETIKAPTCTDAGLAQRVCTYRSHGGYVEQKTVAALGHDEGETIEVTAPTCTEPGLSQLVCTRCGAVLASYEVPATGHQWTAWETVREPSAEAQGSIQRTCAVCGAVETGAVPATGAAVDDAAEAVPAAPAAVAAGGRGSGDGGATGSGGAGQVTPTGEDAAGAGATADQAVSLAVPAAAGDKAAAGPVGDPVSPGFLAAPTLFDFVVLAAAAVIAAAGLVALAPLIAPALWVKRRRAQALQAFCQRMGR